MKTKTKTLTEINKDLNHGDIKNLCLEASKSGYKAGLEAMSEALELEDEKVVKIKLPHESARKGFYIKTQDPSAYVRNKLRAKQRQVASKLIEEL